MITFENLPINRLLIVGPYRCIGEIAMRETTKIKPLVYSCSGCSSAAQLANRLALSLDHSGKFEMSCVAGVGARLNHFVKQARNAREILCIDGCSLRCADTCLKSVSVNSTWKFLVSDLGIKKRKHELPTEEEFQFALSKLKEMLLCNSGLKTK